MTHIKENPGVNDPRFRRVDDALVSAEAEAAADGARRYRTARLTCPHCHEAISIGVSINAIALLEPGLHDAEQDRVNWLAALPENQRLVLELAKNAGLLEAFQQAVERAKEGQVPRSREKFFLTWLQTVRPVVVPRFAVDRIINLVGHRPLTFFSAQGIMGVAVEGHLRLFLPSVLIMGVTRKTGVGRARPGLDVTMRPLDDWIRTRWGYVANAGITLDLMRKRSFGDFARPLL